MKILNKKGYINPMPMYISFGIMFIVTVFRIWKKISINNEINFFDFLFKCSLILFLCFISISSIFYILEFIATHKNWLKFYEDKVSEITIKSLIDDVCDYDLIKDRALEIYKENNNLYLSHYNRKSNVSEKEILEKFQREIPLLINKIKDMESVDFEENDYSVLKTITFDFDFINIKKNNLIWYYSYKDFKSIINSRIMKDILENNSKEDVIAYTILHLFFKNFI